MEPGLLHEPLDFNGRVVYPFGFGMLELEYRHTEFGDEFHSSGGELDLERLGNPSRQASLFLFLLLLSRLSLSPSPLSFRWISYSLLAASPPRASRAAGGGGGGRPSGGGVIVRV
ncbi:hypothetical protein IGI04_030071 [Brassica rapa subsp. trilocularis]|uniref:Uncharacterized protein n=1 Tax=Brassica rapa subsp. trilocularis TaxID=1813537 RepID=A0ABQ7LPM2_BRACM|nr:hypothetical protein IGI04_030071 [Brassica rapa subsp. trilocularis]